MIRRLAHLAAALALAAGALAWNATTPAPASAGGGLMPDLAMAPLTDFRISWANGRRLLRFTAMFVNVGDGHFEVRGHRTSTSQPMTMDQVIYATTARNSPIAQRFPTRALASYAGDGHNHWHVNEMTRYDMWRASGSGGNLHGAKIGLCFLDSDPWNTSLPGEIGPYYTSAMCGHSPSVLSNRMGVSVGWADKYGWYLAWQWIDITGLPASTYYVRAKVDPYGFFLEKNEGNQCAWARISFGSASSTVTVASRGSGCIDDWSGSIYAGDISWAFDNSITAGCAPDLFCTGSAVTRSQMASFLARAMHLPAPTGDHFTDDEGLSAEGDIGRIFEAGITAGCGGTRFCPAATVSREQMASFMARALALPSTGTDFFTDDERSPHEGDINRLAASGITGGCATGRYCPSAAVTRGQMAAFLHRGFGD